TSISKAGETGEQLDPVRNIGNNRSAKIGCASEARAARRGANGTLVSGPGSFPTPRWVRRVGGLTALDGDAAGLAAGHQAQMF
ncbi:phosphopantothenoylcysteine decarboxylase, partial [Salmonella enterica subsp. enterica serovar Infantis]